MQTPRLGPRCPLPLPNQFQDPNKYVSSLLNFGTTSELLQTFCGGVHILDFFTRKPDLYSLVLPQTWRNWVKDVDIMDLLDLLMREDLGKFAVTTGNSTQTWREYSLPPPDLIQYIEDIRRHSLKRAYHSSEGNAQTGRSIKAMRRIGMGMKVKKVHEVALFSHWLNDLTAEISAKTGHQITHLVDFGSGQNYLGRSLASDPYNKNIIAVESKPHNVEGAKRMDVNAKLVPKPIRIINKKTYREKIYGGARKGGVKDLSKAEDCEECNKPPIPKECEISGPPLPTQNGAAEPTSEPALSTIAAEVGNATFKCKPGGNGTIQYIQHRLEDGNLSSVVKQIVPKSRLDQAAEGVQGLALVDETTQSEENHEERSVSNNTSLMVISLHSCGNLSHHGLRSLILNPDVRAVTIVGCCYNLLTERLGPPTFKLPHLRSNHPRLEETSNAFDPHGFPMSERLVNFQHTNSQETGIRLNITARMMAVQAPYNWGREDSEMFFSRHFYRALLQRIFLERGVVTLADCPDRVQQGTTVSGIGDGSGGTQPITIGSLRKFCYTDFVSYVRGACDKLTKGPDARPELKALVKEKMGGITDEEIKAYEKAYHHRKKELSVAWSLMAFSAGVIESMIVVDRWLWLREQKEVKECWVEPVFEYKMSPRNLVVVGVKV